jgi:peptidoglycan/LPS O-acetylase OafA/YrhL
MWYWTYLGNIEISLNGWSKYLKVGHFWTLAIEEQFYIFWPLLVYSFRHRNLCIICTGIFLGAFGFRLGLFLLTENISIYPAVFVLTPARMDALAVGSLVALLVRDSTSRAVMNRLANPALFVSGILLFGIFIWKRSFKEFDPFIFTVGYSIISVLFGALIIIVIKLPTDTLLGRVFSNRILMIFGKYSYAFYVFHPLIINFLKKNGFSVNLFPDIVGTHLLGQIIYTLIVAVGSLLVSFLSWYLWESWFLKLKRLFPYNLKGVESYLPYEKFAYFKG